MINTRAKTKKGERDLFELGIPLSSLHALKLQKTGDQIKNAVRNGIKEGRGGEGRGRNEIFLYLGIWEGSEIPSRVCADSDTKLVIAIP